MIKVGLWQIGKSGPVKIPDSKVGIEKQLEDWIEADPSLIQADLKIVARQLLVEGGYLDLLALDHQGRWVAVTATPAAAERWSCCVRISECLSRLTRDLGFAFRKGLPINFHVVH